MTGGAERPGTNPTADPIPLSVRFSSVGDTCILTLSGELCATSIADLGAHIDRLGNVPCRLVIVDVSELTGLDEAGARVVVGLTHHTTARGGSLIMRGADPTFDAQLSKADLAVQPV